MRGNAHQGRPISSLLLIWIVLENAFSLSLHCDMELFPGRTVSDLACR